MTNKSRLLFPIVLVSASVLLGACTHQNLFNLGSSGEQPADTASQTSEESANNPLNQITAALRAGDTLRCEITDPNSEYQADYLIRNGQLKVSSTDPDTGTTSHVLTQDNASYIWVEGEDTGYTYSFDPESSDVSQTLEQYREQVPSIDEDTADTPDAQDASDLSNYQINCNEATLSDADFTLPEGVEFINPSEMMQEAFQGATESGDNSAAGQNESAGEMTPEQQQSYEEMMQQLQQNQN